MTDHVLTPTESVLNVSAGSAIDVGEPLQEGERMLLPLWMPPTHSFKGQRTKKLRAEAMVKHLYKGLKPLFSSSIVAEHLAGTLQEKIAPLTIG